MSVSTPNTIRSRTPTHRAARSNGYLRAAVAARPDLAPALPDRRDPLEDHLPEEQHEHAGDVEAVGEERPVAGVRPLLGAHPADGEDHRVGLAREQVAAAGSVVGQQPVPGRQAPLDLGAVRRRGARHDLARSPSRPSGRPGCPRLSRAGCRPGWLRSASSDRSPIRPAGACRLRASGPSRAALPSRIARCSTGSASPSISRNTIPGTSVRTCPPWRRAIRRITRSE